MASYPGSIVSFTENTAAGQVITSAYFNDPYNEIVAVETGLLNGFQHALKWLTDNTYDIGASGANRPRNEYLAGFLAVGTNPAQTGAVRLANNTFVYGRNAANGADYNVIGVDSGNVVQLGDASAAAINVNNILKWTTDNTYDIGASGVNRPRDLWIGRNATIGGTLSVGTTAQTGSANRFRMLQSVARSHQSVGQGINSATVTAMTLDTNDFNTDGMWSSGANTKFTAQIAGKYLCFGGVSWPSLNDTVDASIAVRKNGTTVYAETNWTMGVATSPFQTVTDILSLAATDYIEFVVSQNSGGAQTLNTGQSTFGGMIYLGE